MSTSSIKTLPFSMLYNLHKTFANVDFPHPTLPMIPTLSPGRISKLIFFNASSFPSLNLNEKSLKVILPLTSFKITAFSGLLMFSGASKKRYIRVSDVLALALIVMICPKAINGHIIESK